MKLVQIVGIGPGKNSQMTLEAQDALEKSDVIVGYRTYTDLLKPMYPDKEYVESGMRHEEERCRKAFELAETNLRTAIVCSGDSGVYGLAGLMIQLSKEYKEVEIEIVPGVTAAMSGGAVLGAPLGHDFAVISLSDLLTPMEKIEKRLRLAAEGDFCICIYNPGSHKRTETLKRACEIVMETCSPDTICGIVRNIGRDGESATILTLEELRDISADMFTTVFIGNSETKIINGRMVTPRGYQI